MKNINKLALAFMAMFLAINSFAAAKYASVGVKEGNVRKCASTKCGVQFKVWQYTPLEMLSVSSDKQWVKVKDFEGFTGWIHKDLLSETPALSAKADSNIRQSPSGANKDKVGDRKLLYQQRGRDGRCHLAPFGESHHATHGTNLTHHKLTVGDIHDSLFRQKCLHLVNLLGHGTQNADISSHNSIILMQS